VHVEVRRACDVREELAAGLRAAQGYGAPSVWGARATENFAPLPKHSAGCGYHGTTASHHAPPVPPSPSASASMAMERTAACAAVSAAQKLTPGGSYRGWGLGSGLGLRLRAGLGVRILLLLPIGLWLGWLRIGKYWDCCESG